jgi:hypothetical protein
VTTYLKLLENQDHRIYIMKKKEDFGTQEIPVGFVKVGFKKLFFLVGGRDIVALFYLTLY